MREQVMLKGLTETTVAVEQRERRVERAQQKLKCKDLTAMSVFVKGLASCSVEMRWGAG